MLAANWTQQNLATSPLGGWQRPIYRQHTRLFMKIFETYDYESSQNTSSWL